MYDGISFQTCQVSDNKTYTYTAGTIIGGLIEEFKLKQDVEYLRLAHNVSKSVLKHLTVE